MHIYNLMITGIPRAGTTLTAALVDSLENAVCLSEPQWEVSWNQKAPNHTEYVQGLIDNFHAVRGRLLKGEEILDRRDADGAAITNYFRQKKNGSTEILYKMMPVRRPALPSDFLLSMKHNAHYTCVLPDLLGAPGLSVLAIIRHPIPTILSWRSHTIPIQQGRLPAGEKYWPELCALIERTQDILQIQVGIYGLFCERFRIHHPSFKLIRYEDLVQHPALVSDYLQRRQIKSVPVQNQNQTQNHNRIQNNIDTIADIIRIKEYLRIYCPVAYEFYPDIDQW